MGHGSYSPGTCLLIYLTALVCILYEYVIIRSVFYISDIFCTVTWCPYLLVPCDTAPNELWAPMGSVAYIVFDTWIMHESIYGMLL